MGNSVWRYAVCNELFEGWSLEQTATFAASVGYQGLELAPYTLCQSVTDLSGQERRHIRHTIERAGLTVAGLHWLLARTAGLQLNDPDPAIREQTAGYLLDLIDFCADVGGEVLVFGSPGQRTPRAGWSYTEAWEWTAEVMARCGERAGERGVVFCIEPLMGSTFIETVDEAVQLVRQVDHPHFQMMVDVKSMAQDPRPIPEQIRTVAPWIRHVHVNDPNQLGPGMGEIEFHPILAMLDEVDYRGWLSVEVFDFSPGVEFIARQSLENLLAAKDKISR